MLLFKRCLTIAIASIILSAPASAESQTDGSRDMKPRTLQKQLPPGVAKPMIIGGTNAEEGVHPFQVGLMDKSREDNWEAQFCGGTLVAERFVVTAAHCSDDIKDPRNEVQVLVGTQLLDGSGRRVDVARVTLHPSYKKKSFDYDVAVWELAEPVTGIDFATITTNQPMTAGTPLRVTG
jgi:secreted trypsin-like serine protease